MEKKGRKREKEREKNVKKKKEKKKDFEGEEPWKALKRVVEVREGGS